MSVRQTFETFLELPSSAAALRVCRMVAAGTAPAALLVLHGSIGSGKTHLLRAIADAARRRVDCRVAETRAVDLVASLIRHIRLRDTPRPALRGFGDVDLLVVDHLESLLGKGGTQQAVAQLFQGLVASGASVVCASAVPPKALPELSSALEGAAPYADVQLTAPSETELGSLVRHLGSLHGIALSRETVGLIAAACGGDVGRAHGLVAQFAAAVKYPTRGAAAAALSRVSAARQSRT